MSGFDSFLGNEKLIARLKRDISSAKLSHAYIIEGAAGSGKRTLAKLICAAVACELNKNSESKDSIPCMECINCDKIMRGQSPDVIYIEPENGRVQLGVDVIRRLREDTVYAANDLNNKFYIIPEADSMNTQAQNALLKILEEPPEGVMFLLLCENADNLLPTIRSRAPSCRLEILDDKQVESWLIENNAAARTLSQTDSEAFHIAVRLAGGSLGRALELCDPKSAAECMRIWNIADKYISLLANRHGAAGELEFYEYATKLTSAKQRSELAEIYTLISEAIRDLVAAKLTSEDFRPLFYTSVEQARGAASRFPIAQLMRLTDVFANALDELDRNVNIGLAQSRCALAAVRAAYR
ncbi:MAG: hypothetical protein HFE63_02875 [Clostridiales bacterium]|nr:hypothetical protein [Clostridiales bacterium]